ncbi:MAG: inorganic phosphate transporter [Opitutaceae bacterium]|nr:inorganic phosphate transporter [Opitutaceae bacterium]
MTVVLLVLLAALAFEYINGFHDAANAIATVVSTRVLTPRQAIAMAAFFNLLGAFIGVGVAKTIGAGLVDTNVITLTTVLAALIGAIIWNLLTWWLGLPSSSSHALIGGLCGAALATAKGDWSVLKWSIVKSDGSHAGLWPKVVMPMFSSPVIGFFVAAVVMALLYMLLRKATPRLVNSIFGKMQIVSAGVMGLSHGSNDAQKTMGIMALALYTGTKAGVLDNLPSWLGFLRSPEFVIHDWIIISCALTMAAGTAGGGWRIIRTMGHKMVKLQPIHGFAAETSAAAVILGASHFGIPVSTTHVISTAIMGVGTVKRFSAVKWGVVGRIVWAWVLTLPITGMLGYLSVKALHACGVQ